MYWFLTDNGYNCYRIQIPNYCLIENKEYILSVWLIVHTSIRAFFHQRYWLFVGNVGNWKISN